MQPEENQNDKEISYAIEMQVRKSSSDLNKIHLRIIEESEKSKDSIKEEQPNLMTGLKQAQNNPWILAGYICGFLSTALAGLISGLLVNYIVAVTNDENSATQAYVLMNVRSCIGIPTSLFFGFYIDRFNKFKLVMIALTCSIIGDFFIILSPPPYHVMAYISMIFFAIASSRLGTVMGQVLSKYPEPKYRAIVRGWRNDIPARCCRNYYS